MAESEEYLVNCYSCGGEFDALQAVWCNCLVVERSLVCPNCLSCFCKAPHQWKDKFWSAAPQALWDQSAEEHPRHFEEAPNPEPDQVARPLVLIVDDEPVIRMMAKRAIEGLGYCVILASDGAKGLELTKQYMPDLVLSDALMPKMDGREMCGAIKSDPATNKIKTVVMTSLYTSAKHKQKAYSEYHVDAYLSKPLDLAMLQEVLSKLLS